MIFGMSLWTIAFARYVVWSRVVVRMAIELKYRSTSKINTNTYHTYQEITCIVNTWNLKNTTHLFPRLNFKWPLHKYYFTSADNAPSMILYCIYCMNKGLATLLFFVADLPKKGCGNKCNYYCSRPPFSIIIVYKKQLGLAFDVLSLEIGWILRCNLLK